MPILPAASASYGVSPNAMQVPGRHAAELFHGGLENVRVRLGFFGVVAGRARFDQVLDVEQLRVVFEFILLRGSWPARS